MGHVGNQEGGQEDYNEGDQDKDQEGDLKDVVEKESGRCFFLNMFFENMFLKHVFHCSRW